MDSLPYPLLQVYGWGRGEHGRLGFGDNDKSSKMVPQKVQLLAGEDIVQVLSICLYLYLLPRLIKVEDIWPFDMVCCRDEEGPSGWFGDLLTT